MAEVVYITTNDNMRKLDPIPIQNYWSCTGNFLDQYGFSAIGVGRVRMNIVADTIQSSESDYYSTGAFFWSVANGEDGQANVSYVNINCNGSQFNYMNASNTINRRSALSVRLIKEAQMSTNTFDKSKVLIYPNPVQNELKIETDEAIVNIEIFDLLGKQIIVSKHKNIDVSELQKGIYLLKINTDKGSVIEKIIKQ